MKLQLHSQTRQAGFTLLMVLIMVGVSLLILSGAMNRSQTVALLNQRNNDFNAASAAAEGAVEKVFAKMAYDFQSYGVLQVSNNLVFVTRPTSPMKIPCWNNFQVLGRDGQCRPDLCEFCLQLFRPAAVRL